MLQSAIMTASDKTDKQIVSQIFRQVDIESKSKSQLAELMHAMAFEEDVPFAKSLFRDRLIHIYKRFNGQYQKFIASDSVVKLSVSSRELLFKIFRLYHEHKVLVHPNSERSKSKDNSQLKSLAMPDPSNIQEIISFQKKMYEFLKPILNNKASKPFLSQPHHQLNEMNNYPFSVVPERSFRQIDNQFLSTQNPYIPSFGNNSFNSSNFSFDEAGTPYPIYPFNKSDSYFDRHSIFAKRKFGVPDSQPNAREKRSLSPFMACERPTDQQKKGFTTFYEQQLGQPTKKQKRSDQRQFFISQRYQSMKKELELFKEGQEKHEKLLNPAESIQPEKDECNLIKQSVSEYISDVQPKQVVNNSHSSE